MTSGAAPAGERLYTDPRLVAVYDRFNAGDRDFAFYASRIGAARQRILDLGCGTGTFARRLASAGHDVVAIDPAPAMIGHARRQPGADAVRWFACGLDGLPRGAPFDVVVMTGHAFQCLLTDAEIDATLCCVRRVLADGGRFLFETRNPRVEPWRAWTPQASVSRINTPEFGIVELHHAVTAVDGPIVSFDTVYRFHRDETHVKSASRLRFIAQSELQARVAAAGFSSAAWCGDWDGAPFDDAASAEIIALCRV
ncbi:methyltransferase domain protein [Burkholderia ambifaria AMMD]|uniref:Methyltransferase type 12 n=1 Tax=Burkholderia ambifaria (strain ATCC BAA-244 / DSM 16087 / CCUG 44356 / LMG 19182 / AMMD) TaxID=339670 RepID=Q0B4E1_BURCM|nr:class I SAM-dependent methyltransferase [Burkholderia ambifaria]ABI90982.1 Methyltransferase type 12 [Burkholderia ambifaria AMMD]AJY24599.1 methyltransferase domain protein [Burkholderia ambifaria AMMD]MBR7933577.1 class I SAM-dependent methyltransferase [Burkholderia ambifaria]PEH68965.1 class I SAM-dependent methyltransferase [Burkholderia ambifaria]QQC06442.1 class I SAM-dependent methyltransferase [Burkholderia ambifaria]